MDKKTKKPMPHGSYIPIALSRYCCNGDAFVSMVDAYRICCGDSSKISYDTFQRDLMEQLRLGKVSRDGIRLYLSRTLRYEDAAASHLAAILPHNILPCSAIPEELKVGQLTLNEEQRKAVVTALSHRLSIILGGAGSGKTTLIQAVANQFDNESRHVLAAPTGKAARNLEARTGLVARTVHSALGMRPDDDFLSPVIWENVGLVIVDEASMMTLEMLAGFLCKMRRDCRLVLLGDPNQLQSVGSGNVLPDLLELGVPYIRLEHNHRQVEAKSGLQRNVVDFTKLNCIRDLTFDDSFVLREMEESIAGESLVKEAVRRYQDGESIQILSPYNKATELSVEKLNRIIQPLVNPAAPEKKELYWNGHLFREGDRVIITKNDRNCNCSNGDVGILHIESDDNKNPVYYVQLPDGRCPRWDTDEGLTNMALAYTITVHKSQGGEYDTILMPITNSFAGMMYRNLVYTAISRARKQVVLYGSRNALSMALQTPARVRRSMLVTKTHRAIYRCA